MHIIIRWLKGRARRTRLPISRSRADRALYCCFPTEGGDVAAKARLAAEEPAKWGGEAKNKMLDRAAGMG